MSSFEEVKNSQLAICITEAAFVVLIKGHIRIFGDYSLMMTERNETIGNSTLIPNSVIKEIKNIIAFLIIMLILWLWEISLCI
ncbi:MAG: hypothetical protein CM15mV143_120 [Caudoviricetes sp.]|nr:MAG: hypothetical protein CM15mV143_120 [Caudoviricetes sp.]